MENKELKKANPFWITVGFVFALLGGAIGLFFGSHYAFGNYNKKTKSLGWFMLIIAIIIMNIGIRSAFKMN